MALMSHRLKLVREDVATLQAISLEMEREVEARSAAPTPENRPTGLDRAIDLAIRAGKRLSGDLNTHNERASIDCVIAALLALSAVYSRGRS
ncbi:hypothetical protein [uncultured Maricaulis sp.]|uniref:hypothetical protein n=1 Tax=uncultured Maricaulis sp. TaxID=174710 RepID=UPI0030DB6E00